MSRRGSSPLTTRPNRLIGERMDDAGGQRHSRALEAELITDSVTRAEAEAANGLRQYDLGIEVIQTAIERKAFRLRRWRSC